MTLQLALSLIIIGLLAGGLAALIGGKKNFGLNLAVGVGGAFLGNFVRSEISGSLLELLFAAGFAALLLWLVALFRKTKK